MAYSNYVNLTHYIICVACLCFTLYASSILLFKKGKSNVQVSRTPTVYAYFWFTASSTVLLLINAAYILILWRPNEVIYNPMILYYIAGIPTIYVNFVPVADFYLCLDRCFLVGLPMKYSRGWDKFIVGAFGATVGAILLTYFLATRYFAFFTRSTTTSCTFYICLVYELKYPLIISFTKYVFCGLNVAAAAALIGLNYFGKSLQKEVSRKLNKSVMIVSVINLCFAFIPTFIMNILSEVC